MADKSHQATQDSNELQRGLTNRHVQMIALGGAIGTGLFLGSGESIHFAGPSIILGYLITGLICFWMMRAMGEMMMTNVHYHSFVDLIHKYWGHRAGFVIGWAYWASWIAIAMAELTAIGVYIKLWLPGLPQWVPGLITIAILLCINLITVKAFGEVEFWFALIKIVAIIALILIGIGLMIFRYHTSAGIATPANLVSHGGFFPTGWSGVLKSLPMVVFAFAGVEMVGMTAAETQDPEEVIPRAINNIPVRILIFYIGSLAVIMSIFPWNLLNANSSPFVMVFKDIGISGAADIINFVVITAAASSCNSALYTTGRMLAELTYKSPNPKVRIISHISRFQVPTFAIIISALLITLSAALNYLVPGSVFTLISSVATTSFLFIWGAIVITHLKFRKKYPKESPFKMPLSPVSDYLVLIFFAVVAVTMTMRESTLISLIVTLVWMAILLFASRQHKEIKIKK
ncbi:D-serine/D-alanine/glycine transporter [Limosilactobacillus coleohominis 101-4-CHN]|uniref:D-serine/D-alanine/glycine transporter n=1 Tax=Limosilactobacillus coleohominis 101-4-CHN TaxID=575594 RepID=C7XUE2_9LACO|nr:amino acid permease [Limosilactobacillus coleohominis]EEU30903.1 D-serine/D-alanine/glycine transporter [Limosilactobacillus coleohominis 101-4-CHN]